jgi:hypothetical protein
VRDLKDFYRIRKIPAKCCRSLASSILPAKIINAVEGIDNNNCRINAFFIEDGR